MIKIKATKKAVARRCDGGSSIGGGGW